MGKLYFLYKADMILHPVQYLLLITDDDDGGKLVMVLTIMMMTTTLASDACGRLLGHCAGLCLQAVQ